MIKLTEIVTEPGNYDPELGKVRCGYSLRKIYVNPKYIISMIENSKFNEMHQRTEVVENLAPNARFTKMTVAAGTHGTTSYDILGDASHNLDKIKGA